MARSVWTGSVSFGLVNVPVKAYTAVRDHDAHFNQLEKKTGARIRYRKVSDKTEKEVDADDIEMGFEVGKGRWVTFSKQELAELRPASTRSIDVSDFVDLDAVDPIYYERTYWLGPADDDGRKAYDLLRAAMEERKKVAIGSVVMRDKEYLAAIRPLDGALAMSTMRFADEIVARSDIDGVPERRGKPAPKELKLATQIIDSMASDWKPERYRDSYADELHERIVAKDRGEEVVTDDEASSGDAEVVDLMEALQRSVDAAKSRRAAKPRKRAAARSKAKPRAKAKAKKSA